ncbi:MAG TPA: class I SAM-dependent methyltransferase [Ktedonobacteraceae bacterium]|nr:class I SAM-dependent methyltransferase [Ktedonobacteraceae bacterium]
MTEPQHPSSDGTNTGTTSHRFFAAVYERVSRSGSESRFMEPLRKEIMGQACGVVLEIGAGNGLNFALYDPAQVERVEAIEPDSAMLRYAHERVKAARVPITITQTPVERLPFADETFDSAVCTLVFCSVTDPLRGLQEIRRVLKPGGALLMVEHVRAHGRLAVATQNIITPFTRLVAGNCHWNRATEQAVYQAGFQPIERRDFEGGIMPVVLLRVTTPSRDPLLYGAS